MVDVEVAIVGGGPAGLSAALVLGRSRRVTVLFDAGEPRNAPAAAAHNLFTRDGTPPLELNRIGREQLAPYGSVSVRATRVDDVERVEGGFVLHDADGGATRASRLVLATGVEDVLPDVPGLRELWGTGVFHCPYCHGWEVRDQAFVLIAQQEAAAHLARMLTGWSADVTVCPVGPGAVSAEALAGLQEHGIAVRPAVRELVGRPGGVVEDVVLVDGSRLGPAAVFTSAPVRQRSSLPARLGCTIGSEGMFAGLVEVDERGGTGVPGLFVVGDAARGMPQVVAAAAGGALTAAMINGELIMAGVLPRG
ncbi:MAG: NAD(P)/FAD-dependent oxidoreductase [Alphaproteobacteria bacterium]|nr:NAD(P)/FAD-dependent oxidoreductase [Alphaproteobacteria bacterium]